MTPVERALARDEIERLVRDDGTARSAVKTNRGVEVVRLSRHVSQRPQWSRAVQRRAEKRAGRLW